MLFPKKMKPVVEPKKKELADAPDDALFFVTNGPALRNLKELYNALKKMSDDQFNHHTKRDGNDFANWVEQVLHDRDCAAKLRRAHTRKGALAAIATCVS